MNLKNISYILSISLVGYFLYWNYSSPVITPAVEEKKEIVKEPELANPEKTEVDLSWLDFKLPKIENLKENEPAKPVVEPILPDDPSIAFILKDMESKWELDIGLIDLNHHLKAFSQVQPHDFNLEIKNLAQDKEFKEYLKQQAIALDLKITQEEKLSYPELGEKAEDLIKNDEQKIIHETYLNRISQYIGELFKDEVEPEVSEIDEADYARIYEENLISAGREKLPQLLINIYKAHEDGKLSESDRLKIIKKENKDFTVTSFILTTSADIVEYIVSVSKEDAPYLNNGKSVDCLVLVNERTVLQFTSVVGAGKPQEWSSFDILAYNPGSWTDLFKKINIDKYELNHVFCDADKNCSINL